MENSFVFETEAEARAAADDMHNTFKDNSTHLMTLNTHKLVEFMGLYKEVEPEVIEAIEERFGGGEPVTIVSFRTQVASYPDKGVFFPTIRPELAVRGDETLVFHKDFSLPFACLDISPMEGVDVTLQ